MFLVVLAAVQLTVVHLIDGRTVTINPMLVTKLVEARDDGDSDKQMTRGVNCVIYFIDGSYLSTAEKCLDITNRWMQQRAPGGS